MAGDAATNAAARVKPSQEDLSQIDRPAQDNTWHDSPKVNKDALKEKVQGFYKGNPKEDAKDVAGQGTSTAQNGGPGTSGGVDTQSGAYAAVNTLQQKADENVDQETKDKARAKKEEYRARAKEYLKKKMPQDRRDQTIWRLKVHCCKTLP
jgi:hypothetical protein